VLFNRYLFGSVCVCGLLTLRLAWYHEHSAVTATDFCSCWTSLVELSSSAAAQSRHHLKMSLELSSFLHGQLGQWMSYNFVANGFHTKKLCSNKWSAI